MQNVEYKRDLYFCLFSLKKGGIYSSKTEPQSETHALSSKKKKLNKLNRK